MPPSPWMNDSNGDASARTCPDFQIANTNNPYSVTTCALNSNKEELSPYEHQQSASTKGVTLLAVRKI
nr:hypothetical protein [Tanacetum cinerariifolium]